MDTIKTRLHRISQRIALSHAALVAPLRKEANITGREVREGAAATLSDAALDLYNLLRMPDSLLELSSPSDDDIEAEERVGRSAQSDGDDDEDDEDDDDEDDDEDDDDEDDNDEDDNDEDDDDEAEGRDPDVLREELLRRELRALCQTIGKVSR